MWAGQQHAPAHPAPSPTTKPAVYQLYYLPVTATSSRPGTVRLDFTDASNLPGFDSYVIFQDSAKIDQVKAGPPYLLPNLDRKTRHCYQVAALVVTDQPTPPVPKAACLTA
jgi:hypothetical protein